MKQRRKTELVLNKKPQLKALKKAIYIEVSKYILDLSKLVFGGVILTMILMPI